MSPEANELSWATVDVDNDEELELLRIQEEQEAGERVRAEVKRLQELGIIDKHGHRIRTDIPRDMREDSECDL